ncbi:MAG: hypothetical protein JWQ69_169 [Pseudomonas sp.]|nr:hypothetical protein [Pseudomonas sp.]
MKITKTMCTSFLLVSSTLSLSFLLIHTTPRPSDTDVCLGLPTYCSMPIVTRLLP